MIGRIDPRILNCPEQSQPLSSLPSKKTASPHASQLDRAMPGITIKVKTKKPRGRHAEPSRSAPPVVVLVAPAGVGPARADRWGKKEAQVSACFCAQHGLPLTPRVLARRSGCCWPAAAGTTAGTAALLLPWGAATRPALLACPRLALLELQGLHQRGHRGRGGQRPRGRGREDPR